MYVNGLSTSLPPAVQLEFLRTIPGLEQVRMTRPGYAIEYDYFPPTQLLPTLEARAVPGSFSLARSTAPRGMRRPQARASLPDSMPRRVRSTASRWSCRATQRSSGCWWTIW